MDVSEADKDVFGFGPFRLDPARRRLSRSGAPVKLPTKQFDALLYLVENAGRIVEKDELLAAVWGERIIEEGSLTQTIFLLRRALQAGDGEPYIITAPGRGYRFVAAFSPKPMYPTPAEARQFAGMPASTFDGTVAEDVPGVASTVSVWSARADAMWHVSQHWWFVAAGVLMLAVAAGVWLERPPAAPHAAPFAPPPHSVAVLAFTNLSGDPKQEYFSDGLSEELIDALSRVDTVQVAARTSAFSFKGGSATIDEIAHRLDVGAVVEGSVRRDGQRLRITVQLINAVTGFEVWSRTYDRDITGVLALQSDIAAAIVDSLKVTLLTDTAARLTAGGTSNSAAFEAYLRGARLMETITRASAHAALASFDEAIHLDPLYGNAHAGRSAALMELNNYWDDDDVDREKIDSDAALAAADRAVALAPESPYAHTVRGAALLRKADFAQAEAEQTMAYRLGPEDALATRGYALIQCMLGHHVEAETASRHMIELDPLRPSLYHDRSVIQTMDRDFDAALETTRQELAVGEDDPFFVRAYEAWILLRENKPQMAEQECKLGCAWPEFDNALIAYKLGRAAEAQASLDKLHLVHKAHKEKPFSDDATIYAQWGNTEKALAALAEAVRDDPYEGRWIRVDPFLDPIRNTPEFRQIDANLHLPP